MKGLNATAFLDLNLAESARLRPLTLWDAPGEPPPGSGVVCRWSGYSECEGVHSIFRYVEDHGERLRARYLQWIHDIGETQISGRRVIDALSFADGVSYWWLTLLAEKSPWKSPRVLDAIRLFALEEILAARGTDSLCLVTGDRQLAYTIRDLCRARGLEFRWVRSSITAKPRRSLRSLMPEPLRAMASLGRYLQRRWRFRGGPRFVSEDLGRQVFFCSYLFHLDSEEARQGRFHSRYWESLPQLVREYGVRQNWLEIYYPHPDVPTASAAIELVRRFNDDAAGDERHCMVDAYLDWRVVLRATLRWIHLCLKAWQLRPVRTAFAPEAASLSLWRLMRADWYSSLGGSAAIANCLWLELFDVALSRIPRQSLGLYICENQAWERAFIHCWRKHGHGRLVAVPHSTVRFWDLRYFFSPATIQAQGIGAIPLPDIVAVNGKSAREGHLASGYPPQMIADCEALRYNYLEAMDLVGDRLAQPSQSLRLLILGDFDPSDTDKMLKMLESAVGCLPAGVTFVAKPHPNSSIRAEDYPALCLTVTSDHLSKIVHQFDVAYSSNMTSAALDAYLAGLPVIVVLDDAQLNFSPLRGQVGVQFVANLAELAKAIRSVTEHNAGRCDSEFFFLDSNLPRWRQILGLDDRDEADE